ncbi:hypothetical protein ACMU59_001311 [Yersinia enterocolitica]
MEDKYAVFEDLANPHNWLLVADELHNQALTIYKHKGKKIITRLDKNGDIEDTKDFINRPMFLLSGFALENILKAFLIYENPCWVSNGKLDKKLQSHSLTQLYERSEKIPNDDLSKRVLTAFEDGLNSWARYPCALSIERERTEKKLNEELWQDYLLLMDIWGRTICSLLTIGWVGPHKFDGHFKFDNEVFTFIRPEPFVTSS